MPITFSDVLISSYQSSGPAGGNSVPTDSFSLNYEKTPFDYSKAGSDSFDFTADGSGLAKSAPNLSDRADVGGGPHVKVFSGVLGDQEAELGFDVFADHEPEAIIAILIGLATDAPLDREPELGVTAGDGSPDGPIEIDSFSWGESQVGFY